MNDVDLALEITRLRDIREIENLQGRYMYYIQSHHYEEILDMFARHDPEVSAEVSESGVYVGRAKVAALFLQLFKPFFTQPGSLPVHMITSPVIEVEPNGQVAYGMWQTLGCNTFPTKDGPVATWQQGKYDNIFIKEEGRWCFKQFRWLCNFRTPFDRGWVKTPVIDVEPLDISQFPPELHPTHPGERYDTYDVRKPMHFGPLPPAPIDRPLRKC